MSAVAPVSLALPAATLAPLDPLPPARPDGSVGSARGASTHNGTIGNTTGTGGASFDGVLRDALAEVNATSARAGEMSRALATGAIDDVHGTMIANREAEIMVRMAGTVRNKLLDAFHELWRTSV